MELILGKTAGFCYGVERAVNGAKEELIDKREVYCLGDIVHNENVVKSLEKKGMKFINDINDAHGKTIIRAHGITKQIYEIAKENKIELKDLTCPSVLKIHKIAEEYANKGYCIILTGKVDHPEVIGITSYCGEKYFVINCVEDTERVLNYINKNNLKNVLIISQTTFRKKLFDEIIKVIENSLNENINLVVKKTICSSTENRQKETEELSKVVDCMIIIGDNKSSNTTKLYNIALENCKNVIFIKDEQELDSTKIKKYKKIGVMAGASTPKEDIENIVNLLGGTE